MTSSISSTSSREIQHHAHERRVQNIERQIRERREVRQSEVRSSPLVEKNIERKNTIRKRIDEIA